jgi:hypothetical protein
VRISPVARMRMRAVVAGPELMRTARSPSGWARRRRRRPGGRCGGPWRGRRPPRVGVDRGRLDLARDDRRARGGLVVFPGLCRRRCSCRPGWGRWSGPRRRRSWARRHRRRDGRRLRGWRLRGPGRGLRRGSRLDGSRSRRGPRRRCRALGPGDGRRTRALGARDAVGGRGLVRRSSVIEPGFRPVSGGQPAPWRLRQERIVLLDPRPEPARVAGGPAGAAGEEAFAGGEPSHPALSHPTGHRLPGGIGRQEVRHAGLVCDLVRRRPGRDVLATRAFLAGTRPLGACRRRCRWRRSGSGGFGGLVPTAAAHGSSAVVRHRTSREDAAR